VELTATHSKMLDPDYLQKHRAPTTPHGRVFACDLINSKEASPFNFAADRSWHLVSSAASDVLSALWKNLPRATINLDVIGLDSNYAYWAIAYEAARAQHCFVVPLVGSVVEAAVEDLLEGTLNLVMYDDASPDVLECPVRISSSMHDTLRAKFRKEFDKDVVMKEITMLMMDLTEDPGVRPVPIVGSSHPAILSVSIALPPGLRP